MPVSREQLKAKRTPPVPLTVPEVGEVFIRPMSAKERWDWYDDTRMKSDQWASTLIAKSLCDENGVRIFDDSNESIAEIGAWETPIHDFLHTAIQKINKLDQQSREEMRKNLETGLKPSSSQT